MDLTAFFVIYRAACLRAGISPPTPEQLALMIEVLLDCVATWLPPDDPHGVAR